MYYANERWKSRPINSLCDKPRSQKQKYEEWKLSFFFLSVALFYFLFCFCNLPVIRYLVFGYLSSVHRHVCLGFPLPCCIRRVYDCNRSISLTPHGAPFCCNIYSGPFTELFIIKLLYQVERPPRQYMRVSVSHSDAFEEFCTQQSKLRTPYGESLVVINLPHIFQIYFSCVSCGRLRNLHFSDPLGTGTSLNT